MHYCRLTGAITFLFMLLSSCGGNRDENSLFTQVSPVQSHIDFSNTIKETERLNILTYEYLYNGGGVAVGDVNNDGLPDIMFTGNMTPNKLYLNKGNFQFEDITEKAGVAGREKWKTGVVMADVNGDGWPDIYVCYSGPGTDAERANELYINNGVKNGIPTFTESAKKYGLDAPGTYTTTVAFFDMDNDGDLDMFMVNHGDMFYNPFYNTEKLRATRNPRFGNRLYRNDGGVFTDISNEAHIDGSGLNFGLSASISDINNDGWPDIYVTNDYDERDFLYLNNHNGTFREVLAKAAGHLSESAMGSDISDYNNDGRPDIMVVDMLPQDNHRRKILKGPDPFDKYSMRINYGYHRQLMRNTLQLNNGNDSTGMPIFSEVGEFAGVYSTDWSWAPLFADFDNDGWKDLFISNGILRDMTNLDFVKYTSGYSADAAKFGDSAAMWKIVRSMPTTAMTNYLFRNNHHLGFTDETKTWGITNASINSGAVYADLDNDGYLDLVVNRLNDKAIIYRNNGAKKALGNFLRIKLKGAGKNTFGIGAKVYVQTATGSQLQEEYVSRGFQSSVDPVMHFGLGGDSVVQTVKVKWPGGKVSLVQNVKAGTFLTIDEGSAKLTDTTVSPAVKPLFIDVTAKSGIHFTHHHPNFSDFKISPLLPYEPSKTGPCITKGDVNGDGLEDVFIGASGQDASVLYLQTGDGKFVPAANQPWNNAESKNITNTAALFFDADGDGDKDLYIVSGGMDFAQGGKHYQDRIFENDGRGNFTQLLNALPAETESGSCVAAADIDKDGLPDLFVAGKVKPGFFPEASRSFILKNVSTRGNIRFEKDALQTDTLLRDPGMVTDAVWCDLNKDGWEDLVVVGEFMPVTIFENHGGRLENATKKYGLEGSEGWYQRILAEDFDKDGDTDLIIGNIGENTSLKATNDGPVSITYGDFDENGVVDPLLCYYNQGKSYPYYSRDEILGEIPSLQKKLSHYADYADAQLTDIFTRGQLDKAKTVLMHNNSSVYLQNNGGSFSIKKLPEYAQLSVLNGLVAADINGDGDEDVIGAGNFYPFNAQLGPLDAGIGIVLRGDGKGGFAPLTYAQTGLRLQDDIRNILRVNSAGKNYFFIIAVKNNGEAEVLKSNLMSK